jgi:hydrogenase expression/formation protein HypC
MCLALPARIVALDGEDATVDLGGVRKGISVALTPGVALGDYVIVHVGHAIGTVDPDEAERTLALFAELAQAS